MVPVILLIVLIPVALYFMGPEGGEMRKVDPEGLVRQDQVQEPETAQEKTFATVLENSWIITLLLVLMGATYECHEISTRGLSLVINGIIFLSLMLGLIFHLPPILYVLA